MDKTDDRFEAKRVIDLGEVRILEQLEKEAHLSNPRHRAGGHRRLHRYLFYNRTRRHSHS